MDRFIASVNLVAVVSSCYLKSNMDRFIASVNLVAVVSSCYLKSNMDRFIEMHSKKNLI